MERDAYRVMAETEEKHWWYRARRDICASVIKDLELEKGARILEIGAGTGGNLEMLSGFGSVSAMESDGEARALASARAGSKFEISAGSCPDAMPFPRATFDLVCMLDVLEHIDDDRAALAGVRSLMKPSGALLLTVPAFRWLWSAHDTFVHHRRRYTARNLRRVLTDAGFRVARISYFNSLLFPLVAAARVADKLRRAPVPTGLSVPVQPLNEALFALFSLEQPLMKAVNLPLGSSLIAVAEISAAGQA